MTVIDLDTLRVTPFILRAIEGFLADPPDTDFQRGYLAALLNVYREGLGRSEPDARVIAAEAVYERSREEAQ